jgi:FAD/FMN-containing dehydrogenase
MIPYSRDQYTAIMGGKPFFPPQYVVAPGSVEEIQKIVKLANKYKIPIYPYTYGTNTGSSAIPFSGGIILILRRLDRIIEIDKDSSAAIIEPGVSWGKLRKEAKKKGLDIIPPLGPYTGSPIGSYQWLCLTFYGSRYSTDRALSLEVVLPNGEILRTGSWALPEKVEKNPFFRYAFGPDLTGLFRSSMGNLGIITKMAIRLRPLHDVEELIEIGFNNLESALRAMQAIDRKEISLSLIMERKYGLLRCIAPDVEQIRNPEEIKKLRESIPEWILSVGIGGTVEQANLYRKMVKDEAKKENGILLEFTGKMKENLEQYLSGASRAVLRLMHMGGVASVVTITKISEVPKIVAETRKIIDAAGFKEPFLGTPLEPMILIIPYDHCANVYLEQDLVFDAAEPEIIAKMSAVIREATKQMFKHGSALFMPGRTLVHRLLMPTYSKILSDIKKNLDPNNIFNPGGPWGF